MNLDRRQFLAAAALAQRAPRRPNVLLFLSDQESALLPGPAQTPHRARLEQGGVRFTHAFCNTPQCSAARSALLTGLEPHRTGVRTNVDESSLGKPLPPATPNLGSVFQAAGYETGYFGKWHLGNDAGGLNQFGFGAYEKGADERVARAAAEWIAARKAPWLAVVSVLNPHDIYQFLRQREKIAARAGVRPPVSGAAGLDGKPPVQRDYMEQDQGRPTRGYTAEEWVRYRSFYLELVERADACLGTVLAAVPALDETAVVYTSDHGDALGEHGLPFKGPFMYEPLIRIPLVVRAPWALAGGVRHDLVTQADVAPTLRALAGLEWPAPQQGAALTAPLRRDAVMLEYYAKQKWVNPIRTIRTRRWKLNRYDSGDRELYDLETDPAEVRNLAGTAPARATEQQLARRIEAWRGTL